MFLSVPVIHSSCCIVFGSLFTSNTFFYATPPTFQWVSFYSPLFTTLYFLLSVSHIHQFFILSELPSAIGLPPVWFTCVEQHTLLLSWSLLKVRGHHVAELKPQCIMAAELKPSHNKLSDKQMRRSDGLQSNCSDSCENASISFKKVLITFLYHYWCSQKLISFPKTK